MVGAKAVWGNPAARFLVSPADILSLHEFWQALPSNRQSWLGITNPEARITYRSRHQSVVKITLYFISQGQ
jgi:hypothetical protein